MPDVTAEEVAKKLMVSGFERAEPAVSSVSDPIADTPMVVTLEQLRPYENNPRITRNPRYAEIKASILARGLDAPPPITRRPGDTTFIIRNGGNSRLAILRELWSETHDEQFFRIRCLFRPWSTRGEITVLTGHMAENDLHGTLTFIERALGVERARSLYEAENPGRTLTQTELSRLLTADGYPITQSHISRMQDAVRHLLPAIPTVLYSGLGKPQIDRLAALRKATERVFGRHATTRSDAPEFDAVFHDVLSQFDSTPADFDIQRVQDELIGQLSVILRIDYEALALEIVDAETRQHASTREPMLHVKPSSSVALGDGSAERITSGAEPAQTLKSSPAPASNSSPARVATAPEPPRAPTQSSQQPRVAQGEDGSQYSDRLRAHIVTPADTTDRLQAMQRLVAEATGDQVPDFGENVLRAIPVQVGGLHPISDVWYIEPALESCDRLRALIAQLAFEIGEPSGIADRIEASDDGIGFRCARPAEQSTLRSDSSFARATLTLMSALSNQYALHSTRLPSDDVRLGEYLGALLLGTWRTDRSRLSEIRLNDASLVKLFRLIRLARRLLELQDPPISDANHSDSA